MTNENDFQSSVDYAADKAQDAVDAAKENIHESVDTVSARLASLETVLRDNGERLLANAKEMSKFAEKQLRIHPLGTLAVAVITGMAIARLTRH